MCFRQLPHLVIAFACLLIPAVAPAEAGHGAGEAAFPPPLDSYQHESGAGVGTVLAERIAAQPFNLVGSLIFLAAILHTFTAGRLMALSHRWRDEHLPDGPRWIVLDAFGDERDVLCVEEGGRLAPSASRRLASRLRLV